LVVFDRVVEADPRLRFGTACDRICIYRKKINISTVLVSAPV
jgi:hypothetical protein